MWAKKHETLKRFRFIRRQACFIPRANVIIDLDGPDGPDGPDGQNGQKSFAGNPFAMQSYLRYIIFRQ